MDAEELNLQAIPLRKDILRRINDIDGDFEAGFFDRLQEIIVSNRPLFANILPPPEDTFRELQTLTAEDYTLPADKAGLLELQRTIQRGAIVLRRVNGVLAQELTDQGYDLVGDAGLFDVPQADEKMTEFNMVRQQLIMVYQAVNIMQRPLEKLISLQPGASLG